jgi:hypothetical protein
MINPSWNASSKAASKNGKKTLLEPYLPLSNFNISCDNSFKIVTIK